ncbi:MAG: FHA domain-containing protein [Actinomycetales bacterium]|nr:FHA domain-containing protein [Actinomycetales bacterium]
MTPCFVRRVATTSRPARCPAAIPHLAPRQPLVHLRRRVASQLANRGRVPHDGGAAEGLAPEAPVGAAGIPPAVPVEWVAEVWIDPEWYAVQEAEEPMPSPGLPAVVPLAVRSALIGRVSTSKNITPDIDCTQDSGVSRRHAQLTTDGTRWFVEDLGSANGTFVGPASGPLPNDPIESGPKRELADDDRIYVGAWTRIVVRRATPEEIEAATA